MTKGMLYKLLFIVGIIVLSIILILPTVGEKNLEITYRDDVSIEQQDKIKVRFPETEFVITKKEKGVLVTGINLSDAVMNEIRIFPGIKDAKLQKHWAEDFLFFSAKKISLGLDLQGGMQVVLRANYEKIEKELLFEKESANDELKKIEGSTSKDAGEEKKAVSGNLPKNMMAKKMIDKKKNLLNKKKNAKKDEETIKKEKDLREKLDDINERLTDENQLKESFKKEITGQALEMLRNRIDRFGVSEPSIRAKGSDAIEIQLPGVKDPRKVKIALLNTGSVEYRLVSDEFTRKASKWLKENVIDKGEKIPEMAEEQELFLQKISDQIKLEKQFELLFFYKRQEGTKKIFPDYPMALERKVSLAGPDIAKAWVGKDEYGRLSVHFKTTADGASKFALVTAEKNHKRKMAIVIDNKVRSSPQINVQITTGQALIQGDFTREEVDVLTRIIKEGALPVDLQIIEERTVGPSLGQDSIDSGIKAIKVGLIGVMIFVILYYKLGGVFASIGLVLNMIFMLALLSRFGFTLTLPGIAGFILTVGMAVDANVIIYERVKEEIRSGKSIRAAVTYGFDKAFWTIFDANLTTLIAAIFLSRVTGPIKGFAVTLIIGILCSMFVALYITRTIFELITLKKDIKKLSL